MSDRLRRRGTVWYATIYTEQADGSLKREERSTACTDKAAAKAVLVGWERESAASDHTATTTLNDALTAFLADRRHRAAKDDLSEETVEFYECKVGHLVRILGHELRISTLKDSTHSWEYVEQRRRENVIDRTIEKELIVLRAAMALAKSRGRYAGDPDVVVPADFDPATDDSEARSLTRDEARKIFPLLLADQAAAMAFALATGAEDSAIDNARREDVPDDLDAAIVRVLVRGTKNDHRFAEVPLVTDEQRLLMEYAIEHAQGTDGYLFGPARHNLRRELQRACEMAAIPHASTHDLRRTCGQFLIDLSVPLELVSRVMRHADTRITETTYAKVKREDLDERILDSLPSEYARRAHKARGKKRRPVDTLTAIPAPRSATQTFEVDGERRTLTEWSQSSGIAKATLHHRLGKGLTMKAAIALGRGIKGRVLVAAKPTRKEQLRRPRGGTRVSRSKLDCRTGAANTVDSGHTRDTPETQRKRPAGDAGLENKHFSVPRGGIEPSTRGFSIRCSTS